MDFQNNSSFRKKHVLGHFSVENNWGNGSKSLSDTWQFIFWIDNLLYIGELGFRTWFLQSVPLFFGKFKVTLQNELKNRIWEMWRIFFGVKWLLTHVARRMPALKHTNTELSDPKYRKTWKIRKIRSFDASTFKETEWVPDKTDFILTGSNVKIRIVTLQNRCQTCQAVSWPCRKSSVKIDDIFNKKGENSKKIQKSPKNFQKQVLW